MSFPNRSFGGPPSSSSSSSPYHRPPDLSGGNYHNGNGRQSGGPPFPPRSSNAPPPNLSNRPNTNNNNNNGVGNSNSRNTGEKWGSRSVDVFEKIDQVGEGTFGKVYKARNKETREIVALKKVRMDNEKEGFPITAIREIKILKELRHETIVQLKEVVTSTPRERDNQGKQTGIYMVFEYMDHDLTGLMMSETNCWAPTTAQIKCYMKQLLEGLHYSHQNGVLHRDIKGSNLLMNNSGQLKLADFGLARPFTEQQGNYTNRVITLWYRPPELLLGATQYGPAIDMWSAGCILAELLAKKAIFRGENELGQLDLIVKLCGMPTEEIWPGCSKLPFFHMINSKNSKRCLREVFKHWPEDALDLVDKMLTMDPSKRISASAALDAEWFWKEPLPCKPSEIPPFQTASCHEFEAKKRRQSNDAKRSKGPGGQAQSSHQSSNNYPPPPSNYVNNGPKRSYGEMSNGPNRNMQPRSAPPGHSHNYPPSSNHNLPPSGRNPPNLSQGSSNGHRPPYPHHNPSSGR